jgi:4-hydroxy-tetrahydrodipicolinate reductase
VRTGSTELLSLIANDPEPHMPEEPIRVGVAGATGWTGRAVAEAVLRADDLALVSAVARTTAGQDLGTAWGTAANGVPVHGTVAEALGNGAVDVLVDYTSHDVVGAHVLAALEHDVAVVIGSSGLTAADLTEIDALARERGVGVVAAGNFSLTAAMAQAAATLVARHLPRWEIIDYASAGKADAPSGTARELAERLATVRAPHVDVAVERTAGAPEARGATVGGTQIHSVRLPSFAVSTEVLFALPDERLSIRHDAGSTAAPYVAGTLLAIRAVRSVTGIVRGLDTLLLSGDGQGAPPPT